MGTLNRPLSAQVQFEQPVQEPSAIGGIANLAGTFLAAQPKPREPSESSIKFERNQQLNTQLIKDLEVANALRVQGNTRGADKAERKAMLNYSLGGGDLGDSNTQALISTYTGEEFEDVGFSAEEVQRREMLARPDYVEHYSAAKYKNPEATPEELQTAALSSMLQTDANNQLVEQTKINWNTREGQASRLTSISEWREKNRGALTLIGEQGQTVDLEALDAAQISLNGLKSDIALSRPAGLSQEEWAPVDKALDAVQLELDAAKEVLSAGSVEAKIMEEILRGIDTLIAKGELTEHQGNMFFLQVKRDPTLLTSFGLNKVADWVRSMNDLKPEDSATTIDAGEGTLPADQMSTSSFSALEMERAQFEDPQDTLLDASTQLEVASKTTGMSSDEEVAEWTRLTHQGLAGMYSMAADHEGWLGKQSYSNIFNSNYFRGMEKLKTRNPSAFNATFNKMTEAIEAHEVALRAGVDTRLRHMVYDRETNMLRLDLDSIPLDGGTKQIFVDMLNKHHGGDIVSFIKDRGIKLRSEPQEIRNRANAVAPYIMGDAENTDIVNRIESINQLQVIKRRMLEVRGPLEGGEGDTELEGSEGNDTPVTGNGPIATELGLDFAGTEVSYGLPTGFLERTAFLESGGNPSAQNPNSSAGGLFQQIDSNATAYGVTDRFDPQQSMIGAAEFAQDNAAILRRALGREPEGWELYLAHQQGGTGARRLLSNPEAKAVDVVGRQQVLLNGGHEDMSAGEFARIWAKKYSGGRTGPTSVSQATGQPNPSVRPVLRSEGPPSVSTDVPEVTSQPTPVNGSVTSQQLGIIADDVAGETVEETEATPEAAQEAAQAQWEALETQTKLMLMRVLGGTEEDVINMIANGEIDLGDLEE